MEVFREVEEFKDYLISNVGRVKTKSRKVRFVHAVTGEEHFRLTEERFLKVHMNHLTGYKFVQLYKDKKMFNRVLHRLVAAAFLNKDDISDCVNHKDGNKHNNTVENLEWYTNSYNHEHATVTGLKARGSEVGTSKLNDKMVHAIKWFLNKGISRREISQAFKVSRPTISLIANNKIWTHVNFGKELEINL